jgi:hypothetical protein
MIKDVVIRKLPSLRSRLHLRANRPPSGEYRDGRLAHVIAISVAKSPFSPPIHESSFFPALSLDVIG